MPNSLPGKSDARIARAPGDEGTYRSRNFRLEIGWSRQTSADFSAAFVWRFNLPERSVHRRCLPARQLLCFELSIEKICGSGAVEHVTPQHLVALLVEASGCGEVACRCDDEGQRKRYC